MSLYECCFIALLSYILFEKYTYISALEMASPGNQHCASCIGALFVLYSGQKLARREVLRRTKKTSSHTVSINLPVNFK